MARLKANDVTDPPVKMSDLDSLIPQYTENKNELDSYKKICETENAQIKSIMADFALQQYESGGYKVTYSVQKRETMNEEKLLEIAHHHGISEIIKTVEIIDFDALENAIYKGLIKSEIVAEMNEAKEIKEVPTIRLSKIKEKKDGKTS